MNLLLTGAFNYSKEQLREIESLGYIITYVQEERGKLSLDFSNIDVVVCNNLFLYNDIKAFKSLKMIQLTSAGLDRVPLDYINENNIKLYNAKGVYSIPIAEWTVLKILEVYKNTKLFIKQQENKEWIKHRNLRELTNKNVAILGYGDIGNEIAKRMVAFNTKVYAFDLFEPKTNIHYNYDHINNIEIYLNSMDIIIISLPLTNETKGMVNKNFLSKMKSDALIVNISRGKVINQNDLANHLFKNSQFNAVLDVFDEEPLESNSKLWDLDNIVITPHNSYVSQNNNKKLYSTVYENLNKIIEEIDFIGEE